MSDASSRSPTSETFLSQDLLVFYDDFVAFQGYCAFLCDALSSMTIAQLELDDASRRGVIAFAGDLKYRVDALKIELRGIKEKYSSA